MKPISQPHDPLDELLAAAVHGELTPAQRAELDALLKHDPAARAAYQEIQTMHDLLERNHRDAKPDPNFEDRMISGVRRKVREEKAPRETMKESALFLWRAVKWPFVEKPAWTFATLGTVGALVLIATLYMGRQHVRGTFATINSQLFQAQSRVDEGSVTTAAQPLLFRAEKESDAARLDREAQIQNQLKQGFAADHPALADASASASFPVEVSSTPAATAAGYEVQRGDQTEKAPAPMTASVNAPAMAPQLQSIHSTVMAYNQSPAAPAAPNATPTSASPTNGATDWDSNGAVEQSTLAKTNAAPAVTRKLVRDATLDLEVKAYQPAVDTITALATADGGYLDSSNSQRGGNGKLQGTVVAKVAPEKLDAFLLKLRELGELKNQSVSTEDVTKDYYDTQARLDNSRRMETQLQELLKRDTGRVADLLQVERELGRVRGEIEQMQGQLKLYDFQVQYATVTISLAEKDLNKAAAYLLQEHDQFALFVRNVEDAFAQAKAAADTCKAEILNADLEHGSDNTLNATLAFSVPPDQVDGFLAKVKALGRVDNFTRTTSRVANDGGDPDQPADETRTDRDPAQVQLTIRADDESPRQQTQITVASSGDIDAQAQALKDGAEKSGAAVVGASGAGAPDGTETAVLTFRLPLAKVGDFMPGLQKLGRVEALAVRRDDRPGETAAETDAPAEIDLRLHNVPAVSLENEQPRQATQLAVVSTGDVDAQAQQMKADALQAGMTVTASTYDRSPDGTEQAALTFRLPLTQAAAFTATLEKLGRVESLAVQRNDVTGPNSTDPNAPAEISLTLHNEPAIVAEDQGVWATLKHLFGGGVEAFLNSVATIGVLLAFVVPWVVALAVVAWTARRIYVRYRSRPTSTRSA
jgi:hypothetical protein